MSVGLTENIKKEELSMCYSHALAAWGGLNFEKPRIDNDSVDAELVLRGMKDNWKFSSPRLFIQFKATASADFDSKGNLKFVLSKKNYDDLRNPSQVPRILVIFCIPRGVNTVEHHGTKTSINGTCYWASLEGMPQIKNTKKPSQ